eukprot:225097_1
MTESGEEYIPVNLSTKEDVVRDDVDSPSWTKFFEIQTHDFQSVFSVRFDPDSRFLATTSSDAKVRIYDMADGTLKTTITTPGHGRLEPFPVTCVRWSPSKYENDRATGMSHVKLVFFGFSLSYRARVFHTVDILHLPHP